MKRLIIPFAGIALMLLLNSASCTREPSADFSFTTPAEVGELIQFTNLSTNASTYSWDFGDGENSTEESPVHQFEKPDTYTVFLTAEGKGGTASTTKAVTVTGITYSFRNSTSYTLYEFCSYHWTGEEIVDFIEHGTLSTGAETEVVITDKNNVDFAFRFSAGGDVYISAETYNLTINQHNSLIINDQTSIYGGSDKKSAEMRDGLLELKRVKAESQLLPR
ncbi:MAG TPA: PKD domain-containing protein [Bacteroides sp.]|nr:PKD domain-containing protein [Bacteroides sp.]